LSPACIEDNKSNDDEMHDETDVGITWR